MGKETQQQKNKNKFNSSYSYSSSISLDQDNTYKGKAMNSIAKSGFEVKMPDFVKIVGSYAMISHYKISNKYM